MSILRDIPLTGEVVSLLIFCVLLICLGIVGALGALGTFGAFGSRQTRSSGISPRRIFVPVLVLAACFGLVFGVRYLLESVWKPFPDKIDVRIYVAVALALGVIVLGIRQLRLRFGRLRLAIVASLSVIALICPLVMANVAYHLYPNVYSLLGGDIPTLTSYDQLPHDGVDKRSGPVGKWWHNDAARVSDIPNEGKVVDIKLDNSASGFRTTSARVYLPPAYFANPSPQLPVLVLAAGVPGAPGDWYSVGHIHEVLDSWAAAHDGLAPIVAAVDANGSQFHDSLCVDSPEGNVMTYLAVDVPREITRLFHADPAPQRWAIGGLSRGGTCALQMVANYPQRYSTFVDMSGELHPSAGTVEQTIQRYFGGDAKAYADIGAEKILTDARGTNEFSQVSGVFIAGTEDIPAQVDLHQLHRLAHDAGMTTTYRELEGGHTWQVWREGFSSSLDWLGQRMGLA